MPTQDVIERLGEPEARTSDGAFLYLLDEGKITPSSEYLKIVFSREQVSSASMVKLGGY